MTSLPIEMAQDEIETFDAVQRLAKDLKRAAVTLTDAEARFLVDAYYLMQQHRIRSAHQNRQLEASGEPHEIITWIQKQAKDLENSVKGALDVYGDNKSLGIWAKSITGIGPVISAGLLAHIDVTKPTVGHIWRFAGLDPTSKWEKKTKRPWNAALKTLCYKIGESFVKFQNHAEDHYGKVFVARKAFERYENADKKYADQAANALAAKNYGKDTDAYKAYIQGILPPAHIHARSTRYTAKLFLSHYHAVGHWLELHRLPPRPWVVEFGGHAHVIEPPNMDLVDGMTKAWDAQNGTTKFD